MAKKPPKNPQKTGLGNDPRGGNRGVPTRGFRIGTRKMAKSRNKTPPLFSLDAGYPIFGCFSWKTPKMTQKWPFFKRSKNTPKNDPKWKIDLFAKKWEKLTFSSLVSLACFPRKTIRFFHFLNLTFVLLQLCFFLLEKMIFIFNFWKVNFVFWT